MMWLLVVFTVLLLILIFKYILPILKTHSELQKDYQNITPITISSIPFVGNVDHFDRKPYMFFKFLLRLGKECQDQDKGLFCVWYSIRPMMMLCSGKGLEVLLSFQVSKSFTAFIHLVLY